MKTRKLTKEEYALTKWMLENSNEEARLFLPQLEIALATDYKCPCGCVTFDIVLSSNPVTIDGGMRTVADFFSYFGGVFVYTRWDRLANQYILAGVELWGDSEGISKLPEPDQLHLVN